MPDRAERFDIDAVRAAWDYAANAYTAAQTDGQDYYRSALFGPDHIASCGDVSGLHVLDLGCGSGWFARELARRGARVTGVDISPRMIEHATRIEAEDPLGIRYVVGDAAEPADGVEPASMDLVTSCLALQDMPDVPAALAQARCALRPDGRLVVSIGHPCSDTPHREWERDADGRKMWLCIDRYFERGPLEYLWRWWLYPFSTPGHHATLEDWFGWFHDAGFVLRALREPCPTPTALAAHPDLEDAARVPYFLTLDFGLAL